MINVKISDLAHSTEYYSLNEIYEFIEASYVKLNSSGSHYILWPSKFKRHVDFNLIMLLKMYLEDNFDPNDYPAIRLFK